jgi:hypothetical protein
MAHDFLGKAVLIIVQLKPDDSEGRKGFREQTDVF